MSKKTVIALAVVAACALPTSASAQFGVGVRAGTLGIGGEAAIALGKHLAIRGGIGTTKYHYDGTFNDKSFTVDTPPSIWNVGVDLYPGLGGFHVSAGVLNRKKFDFTGSYTGSTVIGNNTYTGTINLVGDMTNQHETAPYGAIGFGRTAKSGLGISLDLGAAAMGDGAVTFRTATCTLSNGTSCANAQFNSDVKAEETKINGDIGGFLKLHPIINLSLHLGLGGK